MKHWEGCWREHHACAVARVEQLRVDADRWRWIRAQHHESSTVCVAATSGLKLGTYCPSEELLDTLADDAIKARQALTNIGTGMK